MSIFAGTQGYLDTIPVEAVTRYESAMLSDLRTSHAGLLDDIRTKRDISKETDAGLKKALDGFAKTFA